MLTIYSIGRAISSNRIAFPSVFCGGGDWEISCRGGTLRAGGDFLVFGEMRSVGEGRMLALSFAEAVEGSSYFCRTAGRAGADGGCEGWNMGRSGAFAGEIFAVDGDLLLLSGGGFGGGAEGSVEAREAAGVILEGGGRMEDGPGGEDSAQGVAEPEVMAPKAVEEAGETGAGGILKVIKPVVREDFPVADGLPALGEIRRDDLARKAEARKKDDVRVSRKVPEGAQRVSKGGLRLGKDSPSDNASAGGQNTINESELW